MKKPMDKVDMGFIILTLFITLFLVGNMFINVPVSYRNSDDGAALSIDSDVNQINGIIALDGEWKFYGGELLTFDQESEQKPILVEVPRTWDHSANYTNMKSKFGYGTYQLQVTAIDANNKIMGLSVNCIPCAYKIFINEKLIGQNGIIGDSMGTEKADIRPNLLYFAVPSDEFVITMQVSNYHFAKGGFWTSMYLGQSKQYTEVLSG